MQDSLTATNFMIYAAKHYDNPIVDDNEFISDLNRFKYIKRLFSRYNETGELKERLILNHIIILYNIFGDSCTAMLFFKLQNYHHMLKPFLMLLNRMPDKIEVNDRLVYNNMIPTCPEIEEILIKI